MIFTNINIVKELLISLQKLDLFGISVINQGQNKKYIILFIYYLY